MRRRRLLCLLIILTWFISCMPVNSPEIREMNAEIEELKSRVDSLERKNVTEPFIGYELGKNKPTKGKRTRSAASNPVTAVDVSSPVTPGRTTTSYSNNYSGRCQATTKKGTQCKRSARSGGYCWQHGG